jgi:serine/threonine protein kinase
MESDNLDRLERLFRAAALHPADERQDFLRAAASDDPALLKQLTELLSSHDDAENNELLGESPTLILEQYGQSESEPEDDLVGTTIGPYTIRRHLGHGGMGDVYLGVREEPFKRYVALKVIKRGMDSREVLSRFSMERQILASLDHPSIAKLLDGGITSDGRPYFAMEYVEGLPVTTYCDKQKLTIGQRLTIFRKICETVSYAHQNLVLHRDLKPSNILVTSRGEIKLLDFGIAKLLNPGMSPLTMPVTRTAAQRMTPEYASPEQVKGESLSTASDTYSLGIILYELISGRRPYILTNRTPTEIQRVVCEEQPQRPSTLIGVTIENKTDSDAADLSLEEVSKARETTQDKLRRMLRGDLDNIVLMALRKEASRRYASVSDFSVDIQNYLEGLPVAARPNTVKYRIRKFIKRNGIAVTTASLVVLALVGGLTISLWQANRANTQRDRARALAHNPKKSRPSSCRCSRLLILLNRWALILRPCSY